MDPRSIRPLLVRDTVAEEHRRDHQRLRDIIKIWLLVAVVVSLLKILLGG